MAHGRSTKGQQPSTPASAPVSESTAEKPRDVLLIHGVTEDGEGYRVLRQRNDSLEAGSVLPLREGKPINGDVVRLEPRPESPLLWDVHTELAKPGPPPARKTHGPAQVATERYRRNWDAIWKDKKTAPN